VIEDFGTHVIIHQKTSISRSPDE